MHARAKTSLVGSLLAALAATSAAGCNQVERLPTDGTTDALPRSVDAALTRACATDAACHAPGSPFVVLAGASPSALRDGGYVQRGSLEGSTLAVKILGLPGITGGRMPPDTNPADPNDLALIVAWIAGIDPEDGGGDTGGSSDGGGTTTGTPEPTDCLEGQSLSSPPTFAELWPMIEAQCSNSTACHAGTQPPVMVDAASAYTNLVDATNATDLTFVTPGSPDDSYLWHKLVGTHMAAGGVGSRMPLGTPLCEEGLVGVYAWILGDAPQ